MKNGLKRASLLGLSLLGAFGMIAFINVTIGENSVTIQTSGVGTNHETRLHSLYLRDGNGLESTGAWLRVSEGGKFLDFGNGIVVGNTSDYNYVAVGGGQDNVVNGNNSGIGGGLGNIVNGSNSVIGGGKGNKISGVNSTIAGGYNSTSAANGVVVGGHDGVSSNGGVVLGGSGTKANGNSIALGKNAVGGAGSFAFGESAGNNSAYIDTQYGLLVGTTYPISDVPLVVEGAVKVGSVNPSTVGEIGSNNGCIKAHDGEKNIVWGKSSGEAGGTCGGLASCQFGGFLIQDGDSIFVYTTPYSTNCNSNSVKIKRTCHNGNLNMENVYPYCYTITGDPVYNG